MLSFCKTLYKLLAKLNYMQQLFIFNECVLEIFAI